METINRRRGQLEQRLPCCGLRVGERDWEAVPILFLVALSKVLICPCPHVVASSYNMSNTHNKGQLLAIRMHQMLL